MPPSPENASLASILAGLKRHPVLGPHFTAQKTLPALDARTAPFPQDLHPALKEALGKRGIAELYTHQAQTLEAALSGQDVTVVTPTASGKSLCYQLPALDALLKDPTARALLLFPAKALSHDQLRDFRNLADSAQKGLQIQAYDGDTPKSARSKIRRSGQIILTNPDMLHVGILPAHTRWQSFFQNLRYVVVDEVHTCRGVFGSHVANVLRRLDRICVFHRSAPRFICCSATIANPGELAETLTGRTMTVVNENGAPRGPKTLVFYNPPVVDPERGIRRSAIKEARRLALRFIARRHQSILFGRSRSRVEVLTRYLRRSLERLRIDPEAVQAYRSGYLPEERRDIEKRLREGRILAVVGTNALELGIDIGGLRVAFLCGWPGSIASAWQQIGRAGRTRENSLAVLVGTAAPLDQYIMHHPEYLLEGRAERGALNPHNASILRGHLQCATFELPFERGEPFGEVGPERVESLLATLSEKVRASGDRFFWADPDLPAQKVSLRSASAERFLVQDKTNDNRLIGEVDAESAPFLIHEGAVYLHQTVAYLIEELDREQRIALAKPVALDYYTQALPKTRVRILSVEESQPATAGDFPFAGLSLGEIDVAVRVDRFRKIRYETHQILGYGDVEPWEHKIRTEATWPAWEPTLVGLASEEGKNAGLALQGLAHLLQNVVPLFVLCDVMDFRTAPVLEPDPAEEDQWLLRLYVYDDYPGGIGIAREIHPRWREILETAQVMVAECPCAHGCPSCVGPAAETSDLGKQSTTWLLANTLKNYSPSGKE